MRESDDAATPKELLDEVRRLSSDASDLWDTAYRTDDEDAAQELSDRAEVIQALGQRACARAVPVILRRLETEQDGFVRDTILSALSRLEG